MRAPTLFIVTALLFRPADDQAFLRWPEALETRHLGAQVDLLPLRIEAGGLQSLEATEQVIYEARHAPVSVGLFRSLFGTKLG